MKKLILSATTLVIYFSAFSASRTDIDTAIYNLCKEIMLKDPLSFSQETYAELAYLKRNYNLPALKLNNQLYRKNIFNDYYYDKFYLYSKFLNEDAIVSSDCLNLPNSTDKSVHEVNKLLFYVLYPNSIALPDNTIKLIEQYAAVDTFWGPYKMLTTIYYLKKYNYINLTTAQQKELISLQQRLALSLYNRYVQNKPWSFYKLMALKVLKMNNIVNYSDVDILELVTYYKGNKPLFFFEGDREYVGTLSQIGGKQILEYNACALLWIFLLENKQK